MFATDKTSYPRFFRLVPRAEQYADVVVAIINKLKWKKVAMITYATDFLFDVSAKSSVISTCYTLLAIIDKFYNRTYSQLSYITCV